MIRGQDVTTTQLLQNDDRLQKYENLINNYSTLYDDNVDLRPQLKSLFNDFVNHSLKPKLFNAKDITNAIFYGGHIPSKNISDVFAAALLNWSKNGHVLIDTFPRVSVQKSENEPIDVDMDSVQFGLDKQVTVNQFFNVIASELSKGPEQCDLSMIVDDIQEGTLTPSKDFHNAVDVIGLLSYYLDVVWLVWKDTRIFPSREQLVAREKQVSFFPMMADMFGVSSLVWTHTEDRLFVTSCKEQETMILQCRSPVHPEKCYVCVETHANSEFSLFSLGCLAESTYQTHLTALLLDHQDPFRRVVFSDSDPELLPYLISTEIKDRPDDSTRLEFIQRLFCLQKGITKSLIGIDFTTLKKEEQSVVEILLPKTGQKVIVTPQCVRREEFKSSPQGFWELVSDNNLWILILCQFNQTEPTFKEFATMLTDQFRRLGQTLDRNNLQQTLNEISQKTKFQGNVQSTMIILNRHQPDLMYMAFTPGAFFSNCALYPKQSCNVMSRQPYPDGETGIRFETKVSTWDEIFQTGSLPSGRLENRIIMASSNLMDDNEPKCFYSLVTGQPESPDRIVQLADSLLKLVPNTDKKNKLVAVLKVEMIQK